MGSEYARFKVATGLATSIFLYSFPAGERRGATIQRLKLAFLREGIPSAIVEDALKRLEGLDGPLYLHVDKGLYYFSSQVGLNRIIIDKEEVVKEEEVEEEIRRIEKMAGKEFECYLWPRSNSDIPDNKKLKLILLPFQLTINNLNTLKFILDILENCSTGYRTYKNTLLFLIADDKEYEAFKRLARRFLALKAITTDKEILKTLTDMDKERANGSLKEIDSDLWSRAVFVYRHLAEGSKDGIETFDLGIPTIGEKVNLALRVKHYLQDREMLLNKLSPKVLLEKTFSKDEESKSEVDIWGAFLKFVELPMLEGEHVVKNSIVQGVKEGIFGVKINEKTFYQEDVLGSDITEDVLILRREIAEKIKEEFKEKPPPPSPSQPPITPPEAPKELIHKISLKVKIPWDKLSEVFRGVFRPLSEEGAEVSLELKIDATSKKGIKRDTFELRIKETLNQIGAEVEEERVE